MEDYLMRKRIKKELMKEIDIEKCLKNTYENYQLKH